MEQSAYRPRISRETRLLLITALVAISALWLLARIRYPDRPAAPNPVSPLLTQLTGSPRFEDLALEVSQLRDRLEPTLLALKIPGAPLHTPRASAPQLEGLRIRDDVAVAVLADHDADAWIDRLVARDPASGLALVRVPKVATAVPSTAWSPRRLQQPRYWLATDISDSRVSLSPVFVGALEPVDTPLWAGPVWTAPSGADLRRGSFLFTSSAELAGVVIDLDGERAVVPGETVLAAANRLLDEARPAAGDLGVRVQSLTPSLMAATGATEGAVVTFVDRPGPASGKLAVGDVIEAVGEQPVASRQDWTARQARLIAGQILTVRVRQRGEVRTVELVARPNDVPRAEGRLGLSMRRVAAGAEIVDVERASVGARAGLEIGDIITLIGNREAPTPAQVRSALTANRSDRPVLVAVTRGDTHYVTTFD